MAGEEQEKDAADRSEAATPRRIERAREQGQVALSHETVGFAALACGSLAALFALPPLGLDLLKAMRAVLERGHALAMEDGAGLLGWLALKLVASVAAAAALGATAATLLQTQGLVSAAPLAPRLG
jgi:flagellar biosynthetic protein FlhB